MTLKLKLFYLRIIFIALLHINSVYSQAIESADLVDVDSFCRYITEKYKAQTVLLNSPDAIVRIDNSNSESINNMLQNGIVAGFSKDLVDFGKAKQIKQLIHDECAYYKFNQQAKLQSSFAIPIVKYQALTFKLQQIKIAKAKFVKILSTLKERIHSQNETLQHYYEIDSVLKKLEDSERQIYVDLASQQLPNIELINLNDLLKDIWTAQRNRKNTLLKLEKQNNWSVQVQAGAQQNISNDETQIIQPYFAMLFRYNIGSIVSNKKTETSLKYFMDWQTKQITGVQRSLHNLIVSIRSLKNAEKERLNFLMQNYQKNYGLSNKMDHINTIESARFKQRIEVDRIMMKIEIKYIQHSLALLDRISINS